MTIIAINYYYEDDVISQDGYNLRVKITTWWITSVIMIYKL